MKSQHADQRGMETARRPNLINTVRVPEDCGTLTEAVKRVERVTRVDKGRNLKTIVLSKAGRHSTVGCAGFCIVG